MLRVNNLVGFGALSGGGASIELTDSDVNSDGGTEITFSGMTVNPNTNVIVGYAGRGNGGTLVSATIGGNPATIITQFEDAGTVVAIFGAAIGAVSSVDVVMTFSISKERAGISVYSAEGLESLTATDTGSLAGTSGTMDLDVDAGGLAVSVAYGRADDFTAAGDLTLDAHYDNAAWEANAVFGSASREGGGSGVDCVLTGASGTLGAQCCAALR